MTTETYKAIRKKSNQIVAKISLKYGHAVRESSAWDKKDTKEWIQTNKAISVALSDQKPYNGTTNKK